MFIWSRPEPCAKLSVYMLRMTAMSSSRLARCGKRSEIDRPGFAMPGELARRAQQHPRDCGPSSSGSLSRIGIGLPLMLGELDLGVERVDLADAAVHEQHDARLGLGGEMRFLGRQRECAVDASVSEAAADRAKKPSSARRWRARCRQSRPPIPRGTHGECGRTGSSVLPTGRSLLAFPFMRHSPAIARSRTRPSVAVDELVHIQDDQAECLEGLALRVAGSVAFAPAISVLICCSCFSRNSSEARDSSGRGGRPRASANARSTWFSGWLAGFGDQPRCEVPRLLMDERPVQECQRLRPGG